MPHTDSTLTTDSTLAGSNFEMISAEECFEMKEITQKDFDLLYKRHYKVKRDLFSQIPGNPASQFFSFSKLSEVKKAFWDMETRLKDHKLISRNGDRLKVKGELRDRIFLNKYSNLMSEYPDSMETNFTIDEFYMYDGKLPKSKIDGIMAYYYEGASYFLVDENGNTQEVPGEPVESPDGRSIFCSRTDLVAGYSTNGFCLLRKDSDNYLQKICEVLPENYGLNKVVWISDDQLIAEKEMMNEEMESVYTYVKLIFRNNF